MTTLGSNMRGQWIGQSGGTNTGSVLINFDEMEDHYQGVAYFLDSNKSIPSVAAFFSTKDKNSDFSFKAKLSPIDPATGIFLADEQLKVHYKDARHAEYAEVTGSCTNDDMQIAWRTPIGTNGTIILKRSKAGEKSDLRPLKHDWEGFKKVIGQFLSKKCFYRGQSQPWRLRTSFHRAGRSDLQRYLNQDIRLLHRHLSSKTKHLFDLNQPDQNGSFFYLIQHHGYPTPLLDWTYSPYVAAFFAYRGITNAIAEKADPESCVRIFIFDQMQWVRDYQQYHYVVPAELHFSVGEYICIENDRSIPQQGVSTLTNVDDIESYIASMEIKNKYLYAIDMPVRERKKVIEELTLMGITAGSLFPGLDGICEELKERNFKF